MSTNWTFGQKIGLGFALVVALAIAISFVAVFTLRSVIASKDRVVNVDAQLLIDAGKLHTALERKGGAARGFLLTREERFLSEMQEARSQFSALTQRLRQSVYIDEGRRFVDAIERSEAEHQQASDQVISLRRGDATIGAVSRAFDEQVVPRRDRVDRDIEGFVAQQEQLLANAKEAATDAASSAVWLVVAIAGIAALVAAGTAALLTRGLGSQIGSTVGQVQSSSAELQAAANQQATGAREQATAMSEIATTINELLATSRQIAESAQRVGQIADQTTAAARAGDGTVLKANDAIASIRRQVDLIVTHMLDLSKKAQEIGAVLDIVSEVAEQTNILAINATIEASGAGETGKRFAVVADEIRKLADRVASSTKEIRALIEDVRSAVNTTVMTTETGSKAVDVGSRHFAEVAAAFKQIADLVTTTMEAGREIGLSTKQQTTAVEQVNIAIASIAQATKETEASSGQTLQTASQLATLSRDLLRLIRVQAVA